MPLRKPSGKRVAHGEISTGGNSTLVLRGLAFTPSKIFLHIKQTDSVMRMSIAIYDVANVSGYGSSNKLLATYNNSGNSGVQVATVNVFPDGIEIPLANNMFFASNIHKYTAIE